jgi:Tol biopolymer transport system component
MTIERRADLVLPAVLGDLAGSASPDYIDDVLVATARMRQRRASASIQRWLPMVDTMGASVLGPRHPWRGLAVALVIIALLVASLALLAGAAARKLAPPFGLAEPGLVAFVSGDDIIATMPDGTDRRPLVTGEGVQWGLTWTHRGDRFSFWSAPTTDDPASLWAADRDGSNQHRVTAEPVSGVPDLLPNVSWSPDDRQLAFSNAGVLYVANADGTDVHSVGGHTHTRGGPVWSPDGSLIAYTGQPLNDPYVTTSLWVITPDGLTDTLVIPAEGGNEIGANANPSWSADSRSLLSHTGDGISPNSISIARRDAAGAWSPSRHIVTGGPTGNYLPAWSTTGTRFTFLQYVDGSDPEEFVVMVADADGSHVDPLSDRHVVGLSTPCWSPDDLFVRAATNGTILLFPLDGSAPVEIPTADGPSVGCNVQRRAP